MTAIVVVSIALAFVSGIRGSLFIVMALVAFVIAAIQVAHGQYRVAILCGAGMQVAYMMGLLVKAMRG